MAIQVLCVCLGNICRSPMAESVLRQRAADAGVDLNVVSAGTTGFHEGEEPDERAQQAAMERGYDMSGQVANAIAAAELDSYDYILAMDRQNLTDILGLRPDLEGSGKVHLFMEFIDDPDKEISDPYYGGEQGFEEVLDRIETAADSFLAFIQKQTVQA